jgi:hypothetical protein
MDNVDAVSFDEAAELPDNLRMNIAADIERNRVDVVAMSFLCEAASTAACKPHAMSAFLERARHLKRLNLQPTPGVGEARLEYVQSVVERHQKGQIFIHEVHEDTQKALFAS